MRIGWRKLFSYLTRKPSRYHSIGIEFDANTLTIAVFQRLNGRPTWVQHYSIPTTDWQNALAYFVVQNDLQNTPTSVSFAIRSYQLLQVDRPAVPDEELGMAIQWSVQELLSSQDEMVVDYFDVPAQTTGANKVNVVAIKKDDVHSVSKGIIEAGLMLKSISVEELSYCDLVPWASGAALMLVQKAANMISLNIVKDGKLYFNRSIRGFEKLRTFTEMELQMGIVESLTVEVQRSMDFFESQLKQGAVRKIVMNLDSEHQQVIGELISKAMLIDVEILSPPINKLPELDFSESTWASLGAGLLLDNGATANHLASDQNTNGEAAG